MNFPHSQATTTPSVTSSAASNIMNFLNKGITSGRTKLSRIIHVKPCNGSDENKENVDISARHPPPRSVSPPSNSSLANSIEDVYEASLSPPKHTSSSLRRSRSLDRLPKSGTSSGRRNSYFDVTQHTHSQSLGSPELPPVFTTTYNTIFSTITAGNNNNSSSKCVNGGNKRSFNAANGNVGKNLSVLSDKFKTTEFTFQKSPVRRRANW